MITFRQVGRYLPSQRASLPLGRYRIIHSVIISVAVKSQTLVEIQPPLSSVTCVRDGARSRGRLVGGVSACCTPGLMSVTAAIDGCAMSCGIALTHADHFEHCKASHSAATLQQMSVVQPLSVSTINRDVYVGGTCT